MEPKVTKIQTKYYEQHQDEDTWRSDQDWKAVDEEYMERCDASPSNDSDDSPILSYRYERYRRYSPYTSHKKHTEERDKRSMGRMLAKLFMFCTAMILFCVLMYIPVYSKVNRQLTRGVVAGWSFHTNRDTRLYIRPENITTLHEPSDICPKSRDKKLFLLVVVVSSTKNSKARNLIRETWGNYENYRKMSRAFHSIREKYKSYNFSYDLYPEIDNRSVDRVHVTKLDVSNKNGDVRKKRSISGLNQLLPKLAEALKKNLEKGLKKDLDKTEHLVPEEKRFDDEDDDKILPEFDMNKELGERSDIDYYDYGGNIMKIPAKGYEESNSVMKIMDLLKNVEPFSNVTKLSDDNNANENDDEFNIQGDPDFKVVFLLGLPQFSNDSDVQSKIEAEIDKYGDIIQEDVIDTYNNLTLKSIMMLKWVVNQCNDTVRYILKTDDDMFINMPNLIEMLKNKSVQYEKNQHPSNAKEHLLIGDLICGAKPVLDYKNKWYSPRYMYGGRVYPKYLSGTGYVFSLDVGRALYDAALRTPYFHLEDIYITGMCAARASPRIFPRDAPGFSYQTRLGSACSLYAQVTAHRPLPAAVADLLRTRNATSAAAAALDTCERIRLTQVRRDSLKAKMPTKRPSLPKHIMFHRFI